MFYYIRDLTTATLLTARDLWPRLAGLCAPQELVSALRVLCATSQQHHVACDIPHAWSVVLAVSQRTTWLTNDCHLNDRWSSAESPHHTLDTHDTTFYFSRIFTTHLRNNSSLKNVVWTFDDSNDVLQTDKFLFYIFGLFNSSLCIFLHRLVMAKLASQRMICYSLFLIQALHTPANVHHEWYWQNNSKMLLPCRQ